MGLFDDKTEPATQKKRDDARKKGQVAKSREVVSVAVLMAGFMSLKITIPRFWSMMQDHAAFYFMSAVSGDRASAVKNVPLHLVASLASILTPLLVAVAVASIASNVVQTGPMLSSQGLKWDPERLNPVSGMKRLFSAQPWVELLKACAKVGVIGWVVYGWMLANYPSVVEMTEMNLHAAGSFAGERISALVWKMLSVLTVIAALDYAWQKFQHEMQLRMTKQELKDEFRQSEGAPEVRAAIRRRMRELKRGAMMQAVPTADVVITNPTHYAVALRYDPQQMEAPEVVALGQRLTALRIRELAKQHHVPIVENPPLARSLFAACEVGDIVPPELFAAVAEVLAYVYRLTGKSLSGS